ncbi:Ger(x)C family spore germination protein [Cohnella terricola]|uniref:Ger(X)C family spore germination protein n=1 Tax=Cohnella terricola TaxID=1289167 RepID=A0A559JFK9_9BACL|nr:Ger(x)C family spore germination protein [Cohnella terricola]TVX98659.1 Ger(x)C family spore germination protein [Cohnella terricola]
MKGQPIIQHGKRFLIVIIFILSFGLTGCWDLVEVNRLAIVNFVGLDRNPVDGKFTVYYQVINPTGVAAQKTSGIKSPIYTYRIEANTSTDIANKIFDIIPRQPFFDHYSAMIVSERTARAGMKEILEFMEKQRDRRATVTLFVTDDPLSDIMKTYIPLERLPGHAVGSINESESMQSGRAGKQSRVKDLVENMESAAFTVLPFVRVSGKVMPNTDRYEEIDANQGNIVLQGGAVFKQDRMVGELTLDEMPWFYLLNGKIGVFNQSLILDKAHVGVQATRTSVRKQLTMSSGRPILKINIESKLQIVENTQGEKLTVQNLAKIKKQYNRQISDKAYEFYEKAKRNQWDLLGIEQQIMLKRGKQWKDAKKDKEIWHQTKLDLTVKCTVDMVGITIDPY